MSLPPNFQWLEKIGPLPKLVDAAIQYIGVKEYPGSKNNPVIMEMAKGLGIESIYTSDDTQAWCGLLINHLIRITGKPMLDVKGDKYNYLRARYMENWGNPVVRGEEQLGDIIILKRDGGGHVCIYIAKTDKGFVGIGGNQGNQVSFAEFSENRIVASRRFYATAAPASAKQYIIDSSGKLSTNEA